MNGLVNMTGNVADTVVVGGGLAGLVAATELGRAGQRVLLLEKSGHVGGRAITKEFEGGFSFNLGPHALYRKGAAQRILRALDVKWTGALPATKGGYAVYGGRKYLFPAGPSSLVATGLLSVSDKIEMARVLASLQRIDSDSLAHVSLREWLDQNVKHERVRAIVNTVVRVATYTNDPERLSAGAAFAQLQMALAGNVDYLDHGWQTLVDGLMRSARAAGIEVLSGASVTAVRHEADLYVVQTRSAEAYRAANVVLATSPAVALMLVEGGEETVLKKWADEAVPVRAACLDVALESLPQRSGGLFALGVDRPLYFVVHSASARLAPEGGALVHAMKSLETDSETNADDDRRELEELFDLVQPGWRTRVAHARFLPRITVSNAMVTAAQGGTKGRPGPQVTDMPGLFVAGDWVGGEGMLLDAALASAHHAAQLILERASARPSLIANEQQRERLIA